MACNLVINMFGYYVQGSYPERMEEYNKWQANLQVIMKSTWGMNILQGNYYDKIESLNGL